MDIRLAASGYIGIVVYCLLSLFFGPMGILAYSDLEARVGVMNENLHSLESLNEDARARLEAVQSDPSALAMEARSLGYVSGGEVVIHVGFPEFEPKDQDLGTLVPYVAPVGIKDSVLKTISIAAALSAFFISLLIRPQRKSRPLEKGGQIPSSASVRHASR